MAAAPGVIDRTSPRAGLGIASAAALAATAGDLLMLLVANSLRAESGLRPPALALPVGGALGVVAIPLYALGYRAVARAIGPGSPKLSRVVQLSGAAAAGIGALIHAATALAIRAAVASSAPAETPLAAVAQAGAPLLAAWGAASLFVLAASLANLAAPGARRPGSPRALAWLNPAVLTLLLGAAGLAFESGRNYLVPAAPNLAHVVFFAAWGYALAEPRRAPLFP